MTMLTSSQESISSNADFNLEPNLAKTPKPQFQLGDVEDQHEFDESSHKPLMPTITDDELFVEVPENQFKRRKISHIYCLNPAGHLDPVEFKTNSLPNVEIIDYAQEIIDLDDDGNFQEPLPERTKRLKIPCNYMPNSLVLKSRYSIKPLSLRDRKQEFIRQIEYAAKLRILTFRYCLIAYQGRNLRVTNGKTWVQETSLKTSSESVLLKRSFDGNIKKKKITQESHISCCPSLIDNSYIQTNINPLTEKYYQFLMSDSSSQELKKSFNDEMKNDGFTTESQEILTFLTTFFALEDRETALCRLVDYCFFASDNNALKLLIKAHNYFKTIDQSHPLRSKLNDIFDEYSSIHTRCTNTQKVLEKLHKEKRAKNSSAPPKQTDESITQKRNELSTLKKSITPLYKRVATAITSHVLEELNNDETPSTKSQHFLEILGSLGLDRNEERKELPYIEIWNIWANTPAESKKQGLEKILLQLTSSHSLIKPGSLLFNFLNETIPFPNEIESTMFGALDALHQEVGKAVTCFGNRETPDIEEFTNQHVNLTANLLREKYSVKPIPVNLDFIDDDNVSLSDVCTIHRNTIINLFIKNTRYNVDFERERVGGQITNPQELLHQIFQVHMCDQGFCKS